VGGDERDNAKVAEKRLRIVRARRCGASVGAREFEKRAAQGTENSAGAVTAVLTDR